MLINISNVKLFRIRLSHSCNFPTTIGVLISLLCTGYFFMVGYVYLLSAEPYSQKYYIGITKRPLKYRLYEHLYFAQHTKRHNKKSSWIKSLLKNGVTPLIEEIETVTSDNEEILCDTLNTLEVFYIGLFQTWNIELLNHGQGGQQNLNGKHREDSKQKMRESHTGKKLTEAHKNKISIANSGIIQSPAKRKRISETLQGHPVSKETRALIAASTSKFMKGKYWNNKLSESDVPVILNLIKEGKKLTEIAALYNVSKGNISAIKTGRGWKNIPR